MRSLIWSPDRKASTFLARGRRRSRREESASNASRWVRADHGAKRVPLVERDQPRPHRHRLGRSAHHSEIVRRRCSGSRSRIGLGTKISISSCCSEAMLSCSCWEFDKCICCLFANSVLLICTVNWETHHFSHYWALIQAHKQGFISVSLSINLVEALWNILRSGNSCFFFIIVLHQIKIITFYT